jgi:UDP-4-amino-4,6-dideoxy-N-acetyl-beta-L-altrosamine N-acetyltransferase
VIEMRPVALDDSDQILRWRNNRDVSRYMFNDHPISKSEHDAWLSHLLASDSRLGWIVVVDGIDSGLALITDRDQVHRNAFCSSYLAYSGDRGKGVGSSVEVFLLEYGFEVLELRKLILEVFAFNQAAMRMYLKLGFRKEGLFRGEKLKDGVWEDVHRLAFYADDWVALRPDLTERLPHPLVQQAAHEPPQRNRE